MVRSSTSLLALTFSLLSLPILGHAQSSSTGAVFIMTNDAANNQVISYKRSAEGTLSARHSYATAGRGSGGTTDPLGSQGSLTLSKDNAFLLAVNAGSGEISVFKVNGSTLTLVGTTPCGGSEPVAVAQHGSIVYVLNAGGNSNVTGFHFTASGTLKAIPHSTAFLTTANSGPGSLAFSPDGKTLLVAEKVTGNIDGFAVHQDGTLGSIVSTPSAGPGLFGILFAPSGVALATETGPAGGTNASATSSYSVSSGGTVMPISASVPTLGAATCWNVVTPDGKHVYTANAGSGTISGFSIGSKGALTPIGGTVLATLPSGSTDLDVAVSSDGKFLFALESGAGAIGAFAINADGTLTELTGATGLVANAGYNGVAAF
jgi:6-phosphogluconolactonase (cycloisomerase 2 family)